MDAFRLRYLVLNTVKDLEKVRALGGTVYPSWTAEQITNSSKGDMPVLLVSIKATPAKNGKDYLLEDNTAITPISETSDEYIS